MKGKETLKLLILLVLGTILGNILGEVLGPYLPFLNVTEVITWSPAADLVVLQYDLHFQVKLSLARLLGLALGFWAYRRLK
ncbi:DUF4321 domain-containing protein [Brevibacillus massiliensis]|jgi:hypothetical protein|uniref:DUF4321 domain-containing protein n=1 Tax=Brevibacillus massiliensis TaxID=1118054 RepID=UPI0002E67752|nr:DUF4321 domain-containing protein [Brevibacillus massiliensis]